MDNVRETFEHHENISRRYKNLSYDDTHAIYEALKSRDEEIKKLLDNISLRLAEEINFTGDSFSIVADIFNKAFKKYESQQ